MRAKLVQRSGGRRISSIASCVMPLAQLLLWLVIAGCAIPHVPYRTVYEDPVNYVRLELDDGVLPEWPPTAHAHPAALTADDVTRILNGMIVQEHRIWLQKWIQGEAPFEAVFLQNDIT